MYLGFIPYLYRITFIHTMISFEQLLLEVSIDQLRRDWVESGRMDADLFNLLCQCTNNQSAYATWLVKRIGDGDPVLQRTLSQRAVQGGNRAQDLIDIYRKYFDIFTKQKQLFTIKDINQYRDLDTWIDAVHKVEQKMEEKKRQKDIDRFKIGAVEANGKTYLVYKLPQGHYENHQIAIELSKTSGGRYGGACWCTGSPDRLKYWRIHIKDEDLYIFVNPQNRNKDKFQIQYNYYNDRPFSVTDKPLTYEEAEPYLPFYEFLHTHEGRPEKPKFVVEHERHAEEVRQWNERVQREINHPTRTLEDCRIYNGVYNLGHICNSSEAWIAPLTTALGLPDENRIDVSFLRQQFRNDLWCISTTPDGRSDFRFFHIGYVPRSGNRMVLGASLNGVTPDLQRYGNIPEPIREALHRANDPQLHGNDLQNQVLVDRLMWLCVHADNTRLEPSLERSLHDLLYPRRNSVRAARAHAEGNGRNLNNVVQQVSQISPISFTSSGANFYEMRPDDIHVLFDGLENAEQKTNSLRNQLTGVIGAVIQKGIALLLSDLHRGNEYEDADINHIYSQLIVRLDLATGIIMPNRMNPDALYTIYKAFKQHDNDVTYPPMIASIDAIHNGSLDEYELDWRPIGVTKLYKVPVEHRDLIPYSLPEVMYQNGDIYLGFISKWQFTLSNNGSFMLTGRWGSAGSRSWINSVPGLSQALIEICDRYNIPRGGALRQLQEMCDKYNIDYPDSLKEALLAETHTDLQECKRTCKDLWLDVLLG